MLISREPKVRPKLISHPFSLSKRSLGYRAPVSAALIQRARHVDMHVANRLIRRTSVVLPDGDSWPTICDVDRPRCFAGCDHQLCGLRVSQVEDRSTVAQWDDKEVRLPTDLLRHKDRDCRALRSDRVAALSSQVCAKRATPRIKWGDVDADPCSHDISSESKNACSSSRLSFS